MFRDGHTTTWWAADASLGWWGPDGTTRLVVATTDPDTLLEKSTSYLATNLPRPGSPREADSPHPAADLAEIVRIYSIRDWLEQSYKQVKDELGWADFQVRSATAIRRHQTLVNCALSFCWNTWFDPPSTHDRGHALSLRNRPTTTPERGGTPTDPPAEHPSWPKALRAVRAWLTPIATAPPLVAGLDRQATTRRTVPAHDGRAATAGTATATGGGPRRRSACPGGRKPRTRPNRLRLHPRHDHP